MSVVFLITGSTFSLWKIAAMNEKHAIAVMFLVAMATFNDCSAAVRLTQAEARIQRLKQRQGP